MTLDSQLQQGRGPGRNQFVPDISKMYNRINPKKTKLYTKANRILGTFRKTLGTNKKTVPWPQSKCSLCVVMLLPSGKLAQDREHPDRDNHTMKEIWEVLGEASPVDWNQEDREDRRKEGREGKKLWFT